MNIKPSIRTFTSGEFEKDAAGAQLAADSGPVFILSDGAVSHVLMTKAEFDRLNPADDTHETVSEQRPGGRSLADVLAYDGEDGDFEWEPPKMTFNVRVPELD